MLILFVIQSCLSLSYNLAFCTEICPALIPPVKPNALLLSLMYDTHYNAQAFTCMYVQYGVVSIGYTLVSSVGIIIICNGIVYLIHPFVKACTQGMHCDSQLSHTQVCCRRSWTHCVIVSLSREICATVQSSPYLCLVGSMEALDCGEMCQKLAEG